MCVCVCVFFHSIDWYTHTIWRSWTMHCKRHEDNYVHIYIYRERERERYINMYVYNIVIYIYILYIYIYYVHWFWRYVSCLMHKRFIQKRPSGSKNWGLLAQCECTGKHRKWDVNWIHCKQYTGYDQLLTEIPLIFELLDIRSILNNSMMEFGAQTIFKEFKQCTNNLVRPVRPNAQPKKNYG